MQIDPKIMVIVSHKTPADASPERLDQDAREWLIFADSVRQSSRLPVKGRTQLGANVWLFESAGALPSIVELTNLARAQRLECSVFLVPGDLVELSAGVGRTASIRPSEL